MADLLGIGLSGLRSSQTSLTVTGHNISNVNTAGYSRQEAVQGTRTPQYNGFGYIGSGSTVQDVRRLASDFLTGQLRSATSQNAEVSTFTSQLEQLDLLLSDSTTGVSPALQSFFAALQTAAQNPSASEGREALLAQAEGLSETFNTLYDQLDAQNTLINQQLGSLAGQINNLATSVASYNEAIAKAKGSGGDPNDLMDAREEVVRQISEMVGVQAVTQSDGSMSLFIGTGQPLVVGTTVSTLRAVPGTNDPGRFQLELVSGEAVQNVTTQVSGGQVGGLLAYRDSALDTSYNKLGQLALTFADTINQQLGQGLDLNGNAGSLLFGDINDPSITGLRVLASSTNSNVSVGAALNITDTSLLTASDYRLEFDGTNFSARRLSDNASIAVTTSGTAPGPYTLSFADGSTPPVDQGFEVTLNNLPSAGDSFTLQPTRRGAADIDATLTQADQLGFAGSARAEATLNNRGTGSISAPDLISGPSPIDVATLQAAFGSGLSLEATVTGSTYTLTDPLPTGWSYVDANGNALGASPTLNSGQSNTVRLAYTNGTDTYTYEMQLSGVPQSGDTFTLAFNDKGISDNRNALALSELQSTGTVGGGKSLTTYNDAYSGLVSRVGSLTSQARTNADAAEAVLTQAQNSRDSLSGVNLDEEAAKLVQFQQYYSASAQVIQVARSLFDSLLGAFN